MSHENKGEKNIAPFSVSQNPAPNPSNVGQEHITEKQDLVDNIMSTLQCIGKSRLL